MVGDGRPVVCKKTNAASRARLRAGWGSRGLGHGKVWVLVCTLV